VATDAAAWLPAATLAFALLVSAGGPPLASLALTNLGNVLRGHGEALPAGSPLQDWLYGAAQRDFQLAGRLDLNNGTAWQDLAEVYLDEGDAAAASICLDLAADEGQRDALAARDADRLELLAIAQADAGARWSH
jgi:tetratricopeptide (TPR) repeat protein